MPKKASALVAATDSPPVPVVAQFLGHEFVELLPHLTASEQDRELAVELASCGAAELRS